MLEILFLFGALGWLLGMTWEYVCSLAAFYTVATAFFSIPLIACADYLEMSNMLDLGDMKPGVAPIPPQRFYWSLHQDRLRRRLLWTAPLAVVGWAAALQWPAEWAWTWASVVGWLAGAAAIVATARFLACAVIYVHASHWFDRMAPWAVGLGRRTMYRLSENPDFLGPENPRKKEKEKSVY